jgi:hypothetical protein
MKRLLLTVGTAIAAAAFTPLAAVVGSSDPQIVGAGARATDSYVGINHVSFIGHGYAVGFQDNGDPTGGVTPDLVTNHDFFVEPGRTPPVTQADWAAEWTSGNLSNWHLMASRNVRISSGS